MRCCRRAISKQHVKVSRLCDILRASYSVKCTTQTWFTDGGAMLVYLAEVHQHRGRISSLSWAYKHSQEPFSYHFGCSHPNRCFHGSYTTCSPSYGLCWDLVEFQPVHWNSTKSFQIGPRTTQDTKDTTKELKFLLKIAANFPFESDTFSPHTKPYDFTITLVVTLQRSAWATSGDT